ncbi:MAG: SUMF1/EgtB/PvdO family nonheme iron enzyme [Phycisphaerales bacterium]|nr:SUMF1/EgtB/PvdO family nonheme iron enzyme [Phycisphaerales bacterium]
MHSPGTAILAGLVATCSCVAQAPPSYGIDFVTIGAPGNRNTIPSEVPQRPWIARGAVGYEFRLSRTEITASQWLPFVQAYSPYWTGTPSDPELTSWSILPGPKGYAIIPGQENFPVEMSWRMAARYCNWLHNGQATGAWAFQNGAYDTSTFTQNPKTGQLNDQHTHNPDAKFWIPSLDEWFKGVYYDPDRYGPGEEGYWLNPGGSNATLLSGPPGAGGETNAGIGIPPGEQGMDAGSYPWTTTPWDLLDASGGVREWTEEPWSTYNLRTALGSVYRGELDMDLIDALGVSAMPMGQPIAGLRIASAIPEPGAAMFLFAAACFAQRRRR